MCDGHEGLVRVLDEGGRAFDIADPVDQPVAIDLQGRRGDLRQLVDAGGGSSVREGCRRRKSGSRRPSGDVGGDLMPSWLARALRRSESVWCSVMSPPPNCG